MVLTVHSELKTWLLPFSDTLTSYSIHIQIDCSHSIEALELIYFECIVMTEGGEVGGAVKAGGKVLSGPGVWDRCEILP